VIVGLFLPDSVHLERSTTIAAPQSTVFALVNSFKRTNEWSPWAKIDPATVYDYEGPQQGVGAKMSWQSDHRDVGSGSQEITGSDPHQRVETHLDFGPQGTAEAFFDLAAAEGGTKVTWGFDSDFGYNLINRYFGTMIDSMVGASYEEGLASLKELAESLPPADFADLDAETTQVEAIPIAYLSGTSSQDSAAIAEAFGNAYGQIGAFMGAHGLAPAGQPIAINAAWEDESYAFDAAIPITALPEGEVPADSAVQIGQTYAGKVLKAVHVGPYSDLESTYEKITAYLTAYGIETADRSWDEWVSDPGQTPEEELVTHIYFPIE
ncbi:MAG: SRPBCC family protein, partial [Acidobacteriota bacterium]